MEFEEALKIIDPAFYQKTGKHLNDVELAILEGTWNKKTYEEIANSTKNSPHYLKNDIGNKLWKTLSTLFKEPVNKKNLRSVLSRLETNTDMDNKTYSLVKSLEFPEGVVPLDSLFYIERLPIESECYDEIEQPGALIRIKAPKQMGKTSLFNRILHHAEQQGYRTVRFNLQKIDSTEFNSLDNLLRFLCVDMSVQLQLPEQHEQYWKPSIKPSCSYYLKCLLEETGRPLVLAFDEVDRAFDYPQIYQEFFSLLRSWYEEAKAGNLEIWENLRLLVAYSTENYASLDINRSPFNVGFPVDLSEFRLEQMIDLAKRHQLDLNVDSPYINLLFKIIGGHPYLVRLAFYHLARHRLSFTQLLEDAATPAGIYDDHLRRHLETLQQKPELAEAFKQVVHADQPMQIEPILAYQLQRMGLIKRQGYLVYPRCDLYCQYFQKYL